MPCWERPRFVVSESCSRSSETTGGGTWRLSDCTLGECLSSCCGSGSEGQEPFESISYFCLLGTRR